MVISSPCSNSALSARKKTARLSQRHTWLVLCVALWAAVAAPHARADFYVAPNGSDQNAGTEAAPFATIQQAQKAVRAVIAAGLSSNMMVLLRAGTYPLAEPLVFGPDDSGTEKFSVTYSAFPGETVVISGGRPITGWQHGDGKLWTVQLPDVAAGRWYFPELFVNGQRAVRARTPNRDAKAPFYQLTGATLSNDLSRWELKLAPGQVAAWKNLSDVEAVVLGTWEITRKRLEAVAPQTGTVTLAPPHVRGHSSIQPAAGMFCYFENARAMLDEPGEWYLDRQTGILAYWPLPRQDMTKAGVVAPVLTRLLDVKGTPDHPVRNLHFRGIEFAYTTWELPAFGYTGVQACFYNLTDFNGSKVLGRIEEAIRFEFAQDCSVEDGEIAHLGGTGIAFRRGCVNDLIEGNRIYDISANGVMIGEATDTSNATESVRSNRVANNEIHSCGIVYYGGEGLWAGFTEATRIDHNLLYDLPSLAISVGWQWNDLPTNCKGNVVEANCVHHAETMLADGGGIYFLGNQPGSIIRGNLVRDIHKNSLSTPFYNQCGIYLDDGCRGILVESNIIFRVDKPISHNMGVKDDWNKLQANYAEAEPDGPGFFKAVADQAGPEPAFRKLLIVP